MGRKAGKPRLLIFALITGSAILICFIVVFVMIPVLFVNNITGSLLPSQGDGDVFAIDYRPVWSPDGKKIAFVSHETIFVMDHTGVGVEQLTGNSIRSFSPAWSHDGKQLVFVSYSDDGASRLSTISLEDPASKLLLDCARESWWCFDPVWSRDGSQIAFHIYRLQEDRGDGNWGAAIAKVNGSQVVQVTHLITSEHVSRPVWSPDGQKIALTVGGKKARVLVFSKTGNEIDQLETDTIGDPPSWSSDGARLAYAADGKVCIWAVNDIEFRCIAFHNASNPAWSPDSAKIAIENYIDKSIYLMDVGTAQPVRLTSGCFPTWSPDGKELAFQSSEGIATIASDGSGYTLLHRNSGPNCQ